LTVCRRIHTHPPFAKGQHVSAEEPRRAKQPTTSDALVRLTSLPAALLVVAACGCLPGGAPSAGAGTGTSGASRRPAASGIGRHAVGLRQLTFTDSSRVTDPTPGLPGDETRGRSLPATVWHPASGKPGGAVAGGAAPARGPFPVVLFSHGLLGLPDDYQALLRRWTSAGLVVVAPTYPLTNATRLVSPRATWSTSRPTPPSC